MIIFYLLPIRCDGELPEDLPASCCCGGQVGIMRTHNFSILKIMSIGR